jgi:hypothetical protein
VTDSIQYFQLSFFTTRKNSVFRRMIEPLAVHYAITNAPYKKPPAAKNQRRFFIARSSDSQTNQTTAKNSVRRHLVIVPTLCVGMQLLTLQRLHC